MQEHFGYFPKKNWEELSSEQQEYFYSLSEEELISRWKTEEGYKILEEILSLNKKMNLSGKPYERPGYSKITGTVKSDLSKKPPKFDLRGINLQEYKASTIDEIVPHNFSFCDLRHSNFKNGNYSNSYFNSSDILYSDFSGSILDECNFSKSNLTLSDFSYTNLDHANFSNSWITSLRLKKASLSYVKFSNDTKFYDIDISEISGNANPFFTSHVRRTLYLNNFREQSSTNNLLYHVWKITSNCGESFFRWYITASCIIALFGFTFSLMPEVLHSGTTKELTPFTFYYFSTVTFTTLGFGDITPVGLVGEALVTIEVILGYIMLGGLISIFSNKFIAKD